MPAVTTACVKNIIRRGFSELADPSPSRKKQAEVWAYFGNRCAYCGDTLHRSAKEGHIDHLVSASQGGANALGNRVLSCAPCNEKEKLDRPWEEFLKAKAKSDAEFLDRRQRILDWQQTHPVLNAQGQQDLIAFARAQADEVVALFDKAVAQVRRKTENDHR
jgi:hypothetical protein